MLLSITIPTWNRGLLVEKQLQTIAEGLGPNADKVEVIVCDNCSTDNTAELVNLFKHNNPQLSVRLVQNKENVGIVGNCKVCIEEANAKYTWLLGDDDIVNPLLFSEIISILNDEQDYGMLKMNFRHTYELSLHSSTMSKPFYDIEGNFIENSGKLFCEKLIRSKNIWGFLWISAYIIRTINFKKIASEDWVDNLACPLYLSLAASRNEKSFFLNRPDDILCYAAANSWSDRYRNVDWIDLPINFGRLIKLGYNKSLFFKQLLRCYNPKKFLSKASIKFVLTHFLKMVSALFYFSKSLLSKTAQ